MQQRRRRQTRNQQKREAQAAFREFIKIALTFGVFVWFAIACVDAIKASALDLPEENNLSCVIREPVQVKVSDEDEASTVSMTYPVPLDQGLQDFIILLCEERNIEPGVVFAIIDRESSFKADAMGDNGKSYGLMQIQKKWHTERMERLCCDNLLDPYQNVTVGIDYLSELFERENGVEWALAAYNAGPSGANAGLGSDYAEEVLNDSDALKGGVTYGLH